MARPTKYSPDVLLDAAGDILQRDGPAAVTVAAVSAATGAPNGSLYHRFGSRDMLVAQLWIRTVSRFQEGYLQALAGDDLDRAALDAAAHVVTWTRSHPQEAALLILHRRSQLAATWPDRLATELATLDQAVGDALCAHTRRRYGDDHQLGRVMFALVDVPYAACRRSLAAGQPIPDDIDQLVVDTVAHVLAIGSA